MPKTRRNVIRPLAKPVTMLTIVAVALVAGACGVLGGGGDTPAVGLVPTRVVNPQPTPAATATPEVPPEPTATPEAEPFFTFTEAENLVYDHIRSCADQVSRSDQPVETVFQSIFDSTELEWQVTASSRDRLLSFGVWRVNDNNGVVTPGNATAAGIDSPSVICANPVSLISGSPTPPLIVLPTPVAPAAPSVLVDNSDLAAHVIWSRVYSCYDHFPVRSSFTAISDENGNWVVEGRSAPLVEETRSAVFFYGLWRINAVTGQDFALDFQANRAASACGQRDAGTRVISAEAIPLEVASVLVWAAVYDCFNPRPEFSSFTVRRQNPGTAIVEGRTLPAAERETTSVNGEVTTVVTESVGVTVTEFYGLWFVDESTSQITPWDSLAVATAARSCFKVPTD